MNHQSAKVKRASKLLAKSGLLRRQMDKARSRYVAETKTGLRYEIGFSGMLKPEQIPDTLESLGEQLEKLIGKSRIKITILCPWKEQP